MRVGDLESRVLEGLKRRLLEPDAIADFLTAYRAERKRIGLQAGGDRQQIERRLAVVERQIGNFVGAIADGVATASMKARLLELEREKERLAAELGQLGKFEDMVEIRPASTEAYRDKIAELEDALNADEPECREATNVVRSLVDAIIVTPKEEPGNYEVTLHGALSGLLNLPFRKPGEIPATAVTATRLRYHRYPLQTSMLWVMT